MASRDSDPITRTFADAGFFALRTPLLPLDELTTWSDALVAPRVREGDDATLESALSEDRATLRARLRDVVARPVVREALFVASPVLSDAVDAWLRGEATDADKVEGTLVKYFQRMAARPTPFGLFAGCSVGSVGEATDLRLAAGSTYRRRTRLDHDYLSLLAAALDRTPGVRGARLMPNTSLCEIAGRLRYVEARQRGRACSYAMVSTQRTDYLDATLTRAREGASAHELAEALRAADADVSLDDAEAYIDELIETQVLVSPWSPAVTGGDPLPDLAARLRALDAPATLVESLERARDALGELDATGLGADPARYRAIADALQPLPARAELPTLFQVDMVKPAPDARIGHAVVNEVLRGVELLHRIAGMRGDDELADFRTRFYARFGDREVPLALALDEEAGIGFGINGALQSREVAPLLHGLAFPGAPRPEPTAPTGARHTALLEHLLRASATGATAIDLSQADLARLATGSVAPMPDAFSALATLTAESPEAASRGDYLVFLRSVSGPSGANLLGRFCHADPMLHAHVQQHLRAEEALHPDAIFAEIVHRPEGRVGNVLARPVLRDYEIAFLGRSSADPEHQIHIADLRLSLRDGRMRLRSVRLDREIVPRASTAHYHGSPQNLATYRFLCSLQNQHISPGLCWQWGALAGAPFLPRVVADRVVLASARWNLSHEELQSFASLRGAPLFRAIDSLRAKRGIPRRVLLADGDNELPVDFDNVLSLEVFARLVRERHRVALDEMLPAAKAHLARGPEGAFVHEIVVPFTRTAPTPAVTAPRPITASDAPGYAPGSEWLYACLYTGSATADRVLRDVVAPVIAHARATGAADRWFFLRYGDPAWHIRLRIRGRPDALLSTVLPALHARAAPLLHEGALTRLTLDTYEPECVRYGGTLGVALAERLFEADSDAVLAMVQAQRGNDAADVGWKLALRGVDDLLDDLGFDLAGRQSVIAAARRDFAAEHGASEATDHALGARYRRARPALDAVFGSASTEGPLAAGLAALRRRTVANAPIVSDLRALADRLGPSLPDLARSYVHMHVNRVLRGNHRAQEFVIYDLLERVYESRAARARARTRAPAASVRRAGIGPDPDARVGE